MADANSGSRALAAASQLEKIGFVDFTVDLVKGVYEVIVNASMEQLEAYAELVTKVSKSLEEYQDEVLGPDETEKQEKAENYITEVLGFKKQDTYTLTDDQATALREHLAGISVQEDEQNKGIDDYITVSGTSKEITHENLVKIVLEKLKKSTEHSYDLLKTILKIGMQKVVVTNGEIRTKLTFHIDASDDYSKTSNQYSNNSSGWGVGGGLSGSGTGLVGKIFGASLGIGLSGGYSSRKLSVNVVNEKSTSATNVNVDILGEVRINFRTETFPAIEA
ncbi:MAG: hypothetical protein GX229_07030 [Syntrophomonadaceae bacterium]|nr:hypothetical protein [Syntrophomonadaceae bacterium]